MGKKGWRKNDQFGKESAGILREEIGRARNQESPLFKRVENPLRGEREGDPDRFLKRRWYGERSGPRLRNVHIISHGREKEQEMRIARPVGERTWAANRLCVWPKEKDTGGGRGIL